MDINNLSKRANITASFVKCSDVDSRKGITGIRRSAGNLASSC